MWWGGGGAKSPNKVSFPKFWWWAVSKIGFTKPTYHLGCWDSSLKCASSTLGHVSLVFLWAPNLDTPDCVLLICAALHVKPTGLAGGVALLVPLLFVALYLHQLDTVPLPPPLLMKSHFRQLFGRSSNFHWTICCCHYQTWSSMSWQKYSSGQSPLNLHGV